MAKSGGANILERKYSVSMVKSYGAPLNQVEL